VSQKAWYLRCGPDDVGDRAILVGDRGRIGVVAEHLHDTRWLNEDRGLTTVTGTYRGWQVTVSAFGMGAPIAAVVMHELAQLGVRTFVRLGTVMCLPPAQMGDLVLASGALRAESTSATYAPPGEPAVPDAVLQQALRRAATGMDRMLREGTVGSYDGFYTQMAAVDSRWETAVTQERSRLRETEGIAMDMETSTVLVVGSALGVRAASLCAATVDGMNLDRLAHEERLDLENDLVSVGLDALADPALEQGDNA
jgi:uridine phosphorylase